MNSSVIAGMYILIALYHRCIRSFSLLRAGGAGAVVIILVIFVVVIVRRRRRRTTPKAIIYDGAHLADVQATVSDFREYFLLAGVSRDHWQTSGRAYHKSLELRSDEYKIVLGLMNLLDGSSLIDSIVRIHGVINPQIAHNFEGFRGVLQRRFVRDPSLFRREDWLQSGDSELRRWVMHSFGTFVQKFPWNGLGDSVPVVAVLHGTDLNVAWKILETGFCALSSLDAGFYGRGIYFTGSALYALPYCAAKPQPCFVLCLAIPGNVYPVVEHKNAPNSLLGMPIKSGFQSHYALTTKDGNPCVTRMPNGTSYDELVLDQEAQVVPIAIIEFDPVKLDPLARNFQREIVIN